MINCPLCNKKLYRVELKEDRFIPYCLECNESFIDKDLAKFLDQNYILGSKIYPYIRRHLPTNTYHKGAIYCEYREKFLDSLNMWNRDVN